jgi:membrane dipeptidase
MRGDCPIRPRPLSPSVTAVTADAQALHRDALVVDVHTHAPGFVPAVPARAYRWVNRTTMPPDLGLDALAAAGVDAAVVKAVGDPVVTRWYRGGAWEAVGRQLDAIAEQADAAGGVVVTTADELRAARERGRLAVVLGVEGADCIGHDLSRLDALAARGVRVVIPVHLADNQIGTTCLPWQRYVGPLPVRRRPPGLTRFGEEVVGRLCELGVVVDVSHADRETVFGVLAATTRPVIASHTGARAVGDFERFLTDDELRAVAGTGGVIGLWPYCHRGRGVPDRAALVGHAEHIAATVGADHLCVGTDMNGVPGVMAGYRGELDLPLVTAALLDAFDVDAVRGILGENFLRVFGAVAGQP